MYLYVMSCSILHDISAIQREISEHDFMGHESKNTIAKTSSIVHVLYLFHPKYFQNDIFRYVTLEITYDISRCIVVIGTSQV